MTTARKTKVRPLRDSTLQANISPKDLLFPLQRKYVDDQSQYKIAITTRQWGKSTCTAGETVHDCLIDPGAKWVTMSAGERQSLEWLGKAKEWQQAYRLVIEDVAEDRGGIAEGLLKSSEIRFNNGSTLIAIPANPSTARGYSANINLDEFAYHEDPDAIWAAMFPSTTNPLAGTFLDRFRAKLKGDTTEIRRKLKLRVVSTFNGQNNKFFQLADRAKENGYSKHIVTIHDAIADGMPLDAAKLKAALDDPDIWAQEYECVPMDTAAVLLPYELIAACESPEASISQAPEFFTAGGGSGASRRRLVTGIDFGRKHDLTVAWTDELIGDLAVCRSVISLRNMPTPQQVEILRPIIAASERVALDYTGPGIGFGDYLVDAKLGFGEYAPDGHKFGKVELVTFGNQVKQEVCSKLRMSFERRDRRIPVSRTIRESLHSVQRVTTLNGSITYRAPHNEDGHADEFTALALAERARTAQQMAYTSTLI